MTLDNIELIETDEIGEFETVKAGLSSESLEFILDALTDGLYQNKITAILREYTSNMEDAIRIENKLDKPYYIIFNKDIDTNELWVSFKDHGSGISPDFMKKIFMNWGESTRRNANIGIGGFGIGSKSGLSYQNELYITTTVDNLTSEYILYKTGKLPELTLLNQFTSEEPNGTTIKIQINQTDYNTYIAECRNLRLFKNLVVIPLHPTNYDNDYVIEEHDLFYVADPHIFNFSDYRTLKISNGPVIYQVEIKEIIKNRSSIFSGEDFESCIQVAYQRLSYLREKCIIVKAEVGELEVTLSRDNLKYTSKTSDSIIRKILEIDNFFKEHVKNTVEYKSENILKQVEKITLLDSSAFLYDSYLSAYKQDLKDKILQLKNKSYLTWEDKKEYVENKRNYFKTYYRGLAASVLNSTTPVLSAENNVLINDNTEFSNINSKYIDSYFRNLLNMNSSMDTFYNVSINDYHLNKSKWKLSDFKRHLNNLYTYKKYQEDIFSISDFLAFKIDYVKALKATYLCTSSVPKEYIDKCKKEEFEAVQILKKERAKKAAETRALNKLNKKVEPEKKNINTKYCDIYKVDDIVNAKHIVFLSSVHRYKYTPNFFNLLYSIYDKDVIFINASVLTKRNSHDNYDEFLNSLFYKQDIKFFKEITIDKKIYYENHGFQFFASNLDYRLFNLIASDDLLDLNQQEIYVIKNNYNSYRYLLKDIEFDPIWSKFIQDTKMDELKELKYFFICNDFSLYDKQLIKNIIANTNEKFFETSKNKLRLNLKTLIAIYYTSEFLVNTKTTDHDKVMCFLLKKRNDIDKKILNLKHG